MVLFISLLITFGSFSLASARVTEISPGRILIDNAIALEDFGQFWDATDYRTVKHYTIYLHTPGGNVFSCVGIINRIMEMQRRGVRFTAINYGIAASAGSYIFMVCNERIAYEGSIFMWHTLETQVDSMWRHRVKKEGWIMMRMVDRHIRKLFKKYTNMSDESCKYWLDGGKAQFMSALTAYNVGIATKYIDIDGNVKSGGR